MNDLDPHDPFDIGARDQVQRRTKAAGIVRPPIDANINNEEKRQSPPVTAFHKGLPHDANGLPDPIAYDEFRQAIAGNGPITGGVHDFDVALGPQNEPGHNDGNRDPAFQEVTRFAPPTRGSGVRKWESPLGGLHYDLEGPDLADVAIAPAPVAGSDELIAEMAEVYALAVFRDIPFRDWSGGRLIPGGGTMGDVFSELRALPYFAGTSDDISDAGQRRLDGRLLGKSTISNEAMFRGSAPGAQDGPYLSQFMMIGSGGRHIDAVTAASSGLIRFGTQTIDQRTRPHRPGLDHMTGWREWLDVQNGADVGFRSEFTDPKFLETPRDLATYVHYDELYQAYFNAALLMAAYGVPLDQGFPSGPNHPTRASFATFGGPHLLSILSEVASRGLKAVRRQKFQNHLRGRPEQLAAMLSLAGGTQSSALGQHEVALQSMLAQLNGTCPTLMAAVSHLNALSPAVGSPNVPGRATNYLLPMAFPEGSPMHAAYGAGHATVAGACVTILKAFFDLFRYRGARLTRTDAEAAQAQNNIWRPASILDTRTGLGLEHLFEAGPGGTHLRSAGKQPLTVQGELNKLAANISIGRNMAGVHFYADYYDSVRLGERIAVAILEEQMCTYIEPMAIRLRSFDDDRIIIFREANGDTGVKVAAQSDLFDDYEEWWTRHAT
ncbi:MAG: bromoperoxidase [Pseudomonadota bacterium]